MKEINDYFEKLRFNPDHHLGMGDIRLTLAQQEEIIDIIRNKEYYLIKRMNCSVSGDSNNLGITDDINIAKANESVFCGYEKIKFIK